MQNINDLKAKFLSFLDAQGELSPEGLILQGMAIIMNDMKRLKFQEHSMMRDVEEFHEKMQCKYVGPPRDLPEELHWRLTKFLPEELKEYSDAVLSKNLAKQYDALIDCLYILIGTMQLHGFPLLEGWNEVHKSNMTKTYNPKSKARFGTGVTKALPEYKAPQLAEILKNYE